jgi:DNA-binding beta-propeller fold protein YncE
VQLRLYPRSIRRFLVYAIFVVLLIPISIPNFLAASFSEEISAQQIVVADRDASALFVVDPTTGDLTILHTFVDFFPHDVKFDSQGNLWVLEPNPTMQGFRDQTSFLSRLDADTGKLVTVWQGPGDPETGALTETIRMAFEANGDIILADDGGIVWRINAETGEGSVLTDDIVPFAVAIADGGDIIVLGGANSLGSIFRVNPVTGEHILLASSPAHNPYDIAVASDGTIVVLDGVGSIWKIDPTTGAQSLFFSDPSGIGGYLGMELAENDDIYVLQQIPEHTGRLLKFDYAIADMTVISSGPPFDEAFDLTFIPSGFTAKATIADVTYRATGQSLYVGGRTFYGEKFEAEAVAISNIVDCATLELRKHDSPTGFAEIGFYDSDMSLVKQFGTIDVITLTTGYKAYEFCLPESDSGHLIQANEILAVKYEGGDAINRIDVRRSNAGSSPDYNGLDTYHVNFDGIWHIYNSEGNGRDLLFELTNTP